MAKRSRPDAEEATVETPQQDKTENQETELEETEQEHSEQVEPRVEAHESESDDSDSLGSESEHQSKRAKIARPQLLAQDVQVARETAELFKSNIFKLQIDELIKELRLKETHCKLIERVLHRIHDIIQQVPKSGEFTLQDADQYFAKSKNEVSIPFPDPKPTSMNYKLQYDTPEDVSLVGSFGLKTGIQQPKGMSIDVALTMPKAFFQPKDYMNYKALYKRAFYIAYLADHLISLSSKNNLPIKITYEYVNGDRLCPAIRIESVTPAKPTEDDLIFEKTNFSIRLIVGFEYGLFDSKKLLPDRNCIRIQLNEESAQDLPPTPLYNASILTSTSYKYYLKYLYTNKKATESFRDAVVLGKLWLKQRGFHSHINEGGFGHFEFAILLAALLNGGGESGNKILLHGFSSYQLFKGAVKYLATQDLRDEGHLSFSSVVGGPNSVYKKTGFEVPTIFDKNTKINILWKMSSSSYELLKKIANETLNLLNDVVEDRFRQIFIMNTNNDILKYDTLIQVPIKPLLEAKDFGPLEKISFLTYENFISSKIYQILSKALHERVFQIATFVSSSDPKWSVSKRRPASVDSDDKFINIGLFLNPSECERKVTKGPLHSDEVSGQKFLAFWGNKAQVRKYKDGNIQYSCLWPSSTTEPTVVTITKYILNLHLSENIADHLVVHSSKFCKLLPQPLTSPANSTQPLILPANFQSLKNSYNELSKLLTNINLPLSLKSVLPISPALRNTSLLLPVPFGVSNPDFFNESILQFETSSKWPDQLEALEQTKTAFLLKIDEYLNKETDYQSFLVNDKESVPYNDFIKVLHVLSPDGYGFKFRILTERDEILYLRAIQNANEKQKKTVTDVYLKFNQKYMGSVKHHRAISSLTTHFAFYSCTVRLFKRWLESQLLLHHFSDELIELFVMKTFVDPAPFSVPSSVEAGFLRTLKFLSQWNWKEDPLILDLSKDFANEEETGTYLDKISDKLTTETYRTMMAGFSSLRKSDPHALKVQYFVASKEDISGKLWSSTGIGLPIASRLTALSKAAISLLTRESQKISSKTLKLIFTPALKDYDFVVKVKLPAEITSKSGVLPENKFKNLVPTLTSYPSELSTLEDPVQKYFKELGSRYSNVMIFSCHKYTGLNDEGVSNVITGLINPSVTNGKKKYRVNIGYNIKPTEDEQVEFNKDSVFSQIVTLGGDLVTSFEANN